MKTIRKNSTKKIEAIFAAAKNAMAYTLDTYFKGVDCPIDWIRRELSSGLRSKLIDKENGKFQVCCNSNCWYEFDASI